MIVNRIHAWARLQPTRPAIVHDGVPLGYASFSRVIEAVRRFLARAELPSGRTAVVLVDNLCDSWGLVLALRALGLDTVCVNSIDQAERLRLRNVACIVVTEAEKKLGELEGKIPPGARLVIIPNAVHAHIHEGDPGTGSHDTPPFGGHMLFTSGTTGTFKKVFLEGAREDERNALRASAMRFDRNSIHHGFNFALWTGAGFKQPSALWHVGGCIVLDQRAARFENFLQFGVNSAAPLPPMVRELLRLHGGTAERERPDVELGVSSGFLPLDVAEDALRRLVGKIRIRYSATELISVPMESVFRTRDDLHWLTPEKGRTIQIVDEDGRECPVGREGELRLLTTETDCRSYLDDEETSAKVFRDGFFHPGDMAVRRADGRIRVLGRAADVLNLHGTKVAVAPIEQHIQHALSVDEVCVFSGLNRQGQEEVVVAIETDREPPRPVLASIARKFANSERVRFSFLKSFPRTETGTRKIKRTLLRQMVFSVEERMSTTQHSPVLARKVFAQTAGTPIRVVIYGVSNPKWMAALSPEAPVWTGMSGIGEVLTLADGPDIEIPEPASADMRTVVIPLTERHARGCPRQYPSLIPDRHSIDILADKIMFADFARRNGLAHLCPETYAGIAEAQYPCVLKRADLHSGQGITIATSPQHLQALLRQAIWSGRNFALQSFVDGDTEYVTHCVCADGRILWHSSFAYEKERPEDIRNLENSKEIREFDAPREVLAEIAKFLAPLRYTGPCNVDYKLTGEGVVVIFEINPRLGGSLMLPQNIHHLRDALSCIIDNAA